MDMRKIAIGSVAYIVLTIAIGYFLPEFAAFAAALAALLAGIYMGRTTFKVINALFEGVIIGLVGGIVGGTIATYLPTLTGGMLAIPLGGWLNNMFSDMFETVVPWLAIPSMAIIGFVFGAIGAYIGMRYLKKK